jgi:ARG and Rhodanese-Phosphatase-superfamily-associated Protein domain
MKPRGSSLPPRAIEENVMQAIPKWIWILSLGATVTLGIIVSWVCGSSRAVVNAEPLIEVEAEPSPQAPAGWRIGQPVTYETLTVFPVLSSQDANTEAFQTLDAALASGEAVVTEQGDAFRRSRNGDAQPVPYVSSGAQVNQLVLLNRGNRPLLLLAGEVVSGGKQDRIIAKDRIIPIGAKPLPLDVFCVEHSRWTNGDAKFSAARTMVHPTVREKAAIDSDQSQVWAAVRGDTAAAMEQRDMASNLAVTPPPISSQQLSRLMASAAPTEGYRSIYQSAAVGPSVENFAQEVQKRFERATSGLKGERVVGVIVAYGGEIAWSDIFASSELFDVYWPKLLRSYAVEALTRPAAQEKVSLSDARDFLRPATGHVHEETEPGVYRWRERSEGRVAEIELEALEPKPLTLHWLKVLRTS